MTDEEREEEWEIELSFFRLVESASRTNVKTVPEMQKWLLETAMAMDNERRTKYRHAIARAVSVLSGCDDVRSFLRAYHRELQKRYFPSHTVDKDFRPVPPPSASVGPFLLAGKPLTLADKALAASLMLLVMAIILPGVLGLVSGALVFVWTIARSVVVGAAD